MQNDQRIWLVNTINRKRGLKNYGSSKFECPTSKELAMISGKNDDLNDFVFSYESSIYISRLTTWWDCGFYCKIARTSMAKWFDRTTSCHFL